MTDNVTWALHQSAETIYSPRTKHLHRFPIPFGWPQYDVSNFAIEFDSVSMGLNGLGFEHNHFVGSCSTQSIPTGKQMKFVILRASDICYCCPTHSNAFQSRIDSIFFFFSLETLTAARKTNRYRYAHAHKTHSSITVWLLLLSLATDSSLLFFFFFHTVFALTFIFFGLNACTVASRCHFA